MLRVRIAPLTDGRHAETLTPAAEALALDPAQFSDIVVACHLDVASQRVVVSFEVSATAHLICDRTDVPFDQRVSGQHTVLVVAPGAPLAAATESEDVVVAADDATHADLTEPVRDTLVLALPLRRVSPEAESLDLPTVFGTPPVDDRWAALDALRAGGDSDRSSSDDA